MSYKSVSKHNYLKRSSRLNENSDAHRNKTDCKIFKDIATCIDFILLWFRGV